MAGSNVISSGGIASITIPSTLPSTDPLLCLIISLLNPNQLELTVAKSKKKGNNNSVQLEIQEKTQTLVHRNAILRSITGVDLHNIFDSGSIMNCYLLGGYSVSGSYGNENPRSTSVLASISSWMSVASTLSSLEDIKQLLEFLDSGEVLGKQSFLVDGCGCITLADLDVYFAVRIFLTKHFASKPEETWSDWIVGANVQRWWDVVQSTVLQMVSFDQRSKALLADVDQSLFTKLQFANISKTANSPPTFFYGEEGESIPNAPIVPVTAIISSNTKKTEPPAATSAPVASSEGGGGKGELTEEQRKAAVEKRAKKKAEKAAKAAKAGKANKGGGKNESSGGELNISALDIRVGKIIKAWNHETAEKLYCEEVDLGEPSGPRKIASGLRPFYSLDEMQQDRYVLVLCNLKARNLVGFPSHGMVLCASNSDHTKVEFVTAPKDAKIGERVIFEGYDGDPEAENKVAKKKMFEKLAPDLKTDENGGVIWKGKKGIAGGAQCHAVNMMKNAQVA